MFWGTRMQIDLAGKTAVVTGSTAGIGFAIALRLARCNARVVVNGRTQSRVDEAIRSLKNSQSAVVRAWRPALAALIQRASGSLRAPLARIGARAENTNWEPRRPCFGGRECRSTSQEKRRW